MTAIVQLVKELITPFLTTCILSGSLQNACTSILAASSLPSAGTSLLAAVSVLLAHDRDEIADRKGHRARSHSCFEQTFVSEVRSGRKPIGVAVSLIIQSLLLALVALLPLFFSQSLPPAQFRSLFLGPAPPVAPDKPVTRASAATQTNIARCSFVPADRSGADSQTDQYVCRKSSRSSGRCGSSRIEYW